MAKRSPYGLVPRQHDVLTKADAQIMPLFDVYALADSPGFHMVPLAGSPRPCHGSVHSSCQEPQPLECLIHLIGVVLHLRIDSVFFVGRDYFLTEQR